MKTYFFLALLSISGLTLSAQNVPIDFEADGNGADWTWTTFENASNPQLEIIDNPDASGINTSATVAKFTALQAGQPFAGCESLHGAGIGEYEIDPDNPIIRIMVWKSTISDVGIKLVRVDNFSLGEVKVANTVINQWEQLEFNFSAQTGITFDQIVIFPDFTQRSTDNIIYFDNISGPAAGPTSTTELSRVNVEIFPNPSSDFITVQSERPMDSYKIYSLQGQLLAEQTGFNSQSRIDVSQLSKGIYLLVGRIDGRVASQKFIKE